MALHPARGKKKNENEEVLVESSAIPAPSKVLVGFMASDLDSEVVRLKKNEREFFKEPKEEPFGRTTGRPCEYYFRNH